MEGSTVQQLKAARLERELSLEQVSRATHIRVHYLEAMEAGEFRRIPSRAQARGFLRAYAEYLGLDPLPFLNELDGNFPAPSPEEQLPGAPNQPQPSTNTPTPTQTVYNSTAPAAGAEEVEIDSPEANAIFREIGAGLLHQRELLGLSLDDVVRHTHLRKHYLQALEAGDLKGLPSPVQGRGMLKNYAAFLGLDPEPLLLRFAEGLQARLAVKQAAQPRPETPEPERKPVLPPAVRRILSGDLMIGGLLTIFLVGFMVWGAVRIFSINTESVSTPTAPSIADVLIAGSATETPTLQAATEEAPPAVETVPVEVVVETEEVPPADTEEPGSSGENSSGEQTEEGEATPQTTPPGGAAGQGSVQVYLTVRQRAWMRVTVDGRTEFEGRVIPGSAYDFAGSRQVEILTGNGAALQIFYNQEDLGVMGNNGEVVNRIFSMEGIVTPTPTITPTGTPTPRFTETPRPSPTQRPGDTPIVPALP